jgi:hypothetical protein
LPFFALGIVRDEWYVRAERPRIRPSSAPNLGG